ARAHRVRADRRHRMKLLTALLCWAIAAQAQEYPSKPIRLIVATAPGGLMDVPARLMADYFEKTYGQRLVVENRGGGGGVMAGDAVAKAAPDGYTLAQIQVGNVAINPYTVKDMPFDALADLLAGQVQAIFVGLGVVRTQSTVRVLAVSQSKRLAAAPDIPTAAEAGLPGFELTTWFGVVAPRGIPERIVTQLNRQIHAM